MPHSTAFKALQTLIAAGLLMANAVTVADSEKRNVILIIGDGMDDQQITIARNYLKGASGRLELDKLPLRSTSQVITVDETSPRLPVYVADSANSATAMATGVVTSRGRIATTPGTDRDITTIAEHLKAIGFSTGIVSTASITDATPAAFISHIASRVCENPTSMFPSDDTPSWVDPDACINDQVGQGGPGSIAQQIAKGPHDIILGGGRKHFEPIGEGSDKTLLQLAADNGYQIIDNVDQLGTTQPNAKVLGLFSSSTMPTRLRGQDGRRAEKPKPSLLNRIDWRLGSVEHPEPMTCEKNPKFAGMPSMVDMTDAAINHLAQQPGKGFFLMVESASIDKQSHKRNPCGSIGELAQLDETLQVALKFAKQQPNTLILVTADHGQAAQIIPMPSMYAKSGVPVYSPGHVALILTPQNQVMGINYATNDLPPAEEHTGTSVPLLANDEGVGRVPAMLMQPEIFRVMKDYLLSTSK